MPHYTYTATGQKISQHYPFGLAIPSQSFALPKENDTYQNRYLYNGKEYQDDFELNWYDYGAPVLATQDGKVHEVKNNTSGNGGRRVVIQTADGSFQTFFFHMSKISVAEGDEIKKRQQIGEIGASAFDSETGSDSHLHYGIKKKDSKTGKMEWYDPTEGKGNEERNIVDPQSWVVDPLEEAYRNIIEASRAGNMEEVVKWIKEFERLQDE